MSVEVTARHMEATDGMQEYARRKGEELIESFPRIEFVHVVLDLEKHRNRAAFVIQAKGKIRTEAEETSDNMKASIDLAVEKIETQMRRVQDKLSDHKPAMRHGELNRERGL